MIRFWKREWIAFTHGGRKKKKVWQKRYALDAQGTCRQTNSEGINNIICDYQFTKLETWNTEC
jgi:hypothetical protein